MKFYLIIFLAFTSFSYCGNKGNKNVTITVFNNTVYYFDSIRITSYGAYAVINNVKPGEKVEKNFIITYEGTYEGDFLMKVFSKGSVKDTAFNFGYYPNSDYIKSRYGFEFYDDLKIKRLNF